MSDKLRVGIDVDGVLRNFVQKIIDMAKIGGVEMLEPNEYEFLHQLVGDHTIADHIWGLADWQEDVFVDSPQFQKGKLGYDMFCSDPQFEVHIVTHQRKGTEELTSRWLKKHGFVNHVQTHFEEHKLNAPCQVLIDDKPKNVEDYLNNARMGVLIDRSYNKKMNAPYRVSDLIEAYNLLR